MIEERTININELEDIIKRHFGYESASIKRIWSGTRLNDMTGIDLGPGGILDLLLDVDDGKEDEKEELFSLLNVIEQIGKRIAKQTQRMDTLEWDIKNVEKHLAKLKKEKIKQKPVEINPNPELKEEWKRTKKMEFKCLKCTCSACPSQWEGITKKGEAIYIRYRWGRLTIRLSEPGGTIEDALNSGRTLYSEQIGDDYDGVIDIEEVMEIMKKECII